MQFKPNFQSNNHPFCLLSFVFLFYYFNFKLLIYQINSSHSAPPTPTFVTKQPLKTIQTVLDSIVVFPTKNHKLVLKLKFVLTFYGEKVNNVARVYST